MAIPRLNGLLIVGASALSFWMMLQAAPWFEGLVGYQKSSLDYDQLRLFIAFLCVIALAIILTITIKSHASAVGAFAHVTYTLLFIPLSAIFVHVGGSEKYYITIFFSFCFCLFWFGRRSEKVEFLRNNNVDNIVLFPFVLISLGVFVFSYMSGAVRLSFLNFYEVYSVRSEADFGDRASTWIMLSAYGASSALMAYGIVYRKPLFIACSVFNAYFLYNSFGLKAFLFTPIIVCVFYLYFRGKDWYLSVGVLVAIVFSNLSIYTDYLDRFLIFDRFNDLIIRRFVYGQAFMSFAWFDAFEELPMILMSNTVFFKYFLDYPLDMPYSLYVGSNIFGRDALNANTGMWGVGYANYGLFGILLFMFLPFLLLRIIDRMSGRLNTFVPVLFSVMPAVLFFEAQILLVVVSAGLGLYIASLALAAIVIRRF